MASSRPYTATAWPSGVGSVGDFTSQDCAPFFTSLPATRQKSTPEAERKPDRKTGQEGTLLSVRYRIETVSIPVSAGVAQPGYPSRELEGRRIIHVHTVNIGPHDQEARVTVLTEEDE